MKLSVCIVVSRVKIRAHSAKKGFFLYGGRESSTKMSIRKWCKVFSEAGCIRKANGAVRRRSTEANVNEVRMAFC